MQARLIGSCPSLLQSNNKLSLGPSPLGRCPGCVRGGWALSLIAPGPVPLLFNLRTAAVSITIRRAVAAAACAATIPCMIPWAVHKAFGRAAPISVATRV